MLVSRLENQTTDVGIFSTFARDLEIELELRHAHIVNDRHGKIEKVKVGMFQADPVIAKQSLQNKSDTIFAANTDFFVSIGPQCVLVKSFKFKQATG